MSVLVTGAAGFIGFHVARQLLDQGEHVVAVDNLNSYYEVSLKEARLNQLADRPGFRFYRGDIACRDFMDGLVARHGDITLIIHLAAQAGVRYSLIDPYAYVTANVMGQVVVLEAARRLTKLRHVVYASSSSVYGANTKQPLAPEDPVEQPVSLYAATKRADELISHTYAHLYKMPLTGLRFFTVYGPWGRPDMAPILFTRSILAGEPIAVFNNGAQRRDFTYIDDIVAGVLAVAERPPTSPLPHVLYNLGRGRPENLMDFIGVLEQALGRKAELRFEPAQPGDVTETFADITQSARDFGYAPQTSIATGVPEFARWYRDFYHI